MGFLSWAPGTYRFGLEIGNGLTQPNEHGVANQCVTNVQLGNVGQRGDLRSAAGKRL